MKQTFCFDVFFLVAQADELTRFIKKSVKFSDRLYIGYRGSRAYGLYVMGVGKASVKRSLKRIGPLLSLSKRIVNLGNCGALVPLPQGMICPIGRVYGNNGKDFVDLDKGSPINLCSIQHPTPKERTMRQFPHGHVIDMEAWHLMRHVSGKDIEVHKIVLDPAHLSIVTSRYAQKQKVGQNQRILSDFVLYHYFDSKL